MEDLLKEVQDLKLLLEKLLSTYKLNESNSK